MFPTELVFIDIETTALAGPDADTDAIIEVAAARVNLKTRAIDAWSTLVKPDRYTLLEQFDPMFGQWHLGDFHADRFAGVNFQAGLTIVQALDTLGRLYLTDGATVAGQNPGFDLRYLRRDWERIAEYGATGGGPWSPWPKLDYHQVDLVSPSFLLAMTGAIPGCSLRHTAPYATKGLVQKHRALDDVHAAIDVFWMFADAIDYAFADGHFERSRNVR